MRLNRRIAVIVGALALLAAGGAGIAKAVGLGGGGEQVKGPAAERAKAAALKAAGGGTVLEVEGQDGDGAGVYEVEVRKTDGSTIEVHLNAAFEPVGTQADDDNGSENEQDGEGEN
ncbi:MAG TPA: PepSY domain-containing protein [Gaiellaceae bacterium]|nr:PepSY domain-containing protein [Gaiellaceae bacterium]